MGTSGLSDVDIGEHDRKSKNSETIPKAEKISTVIPL
jgi:hypothetical protein